MKIGMVVTKISVILRKFLSYLQAAKMWWTTK